MSKNNKFIGNSPEKFSCQKESIFISMNIRNIILEEIDDFDWIRDIPSIDITNPKVGYVYNWDGYSDYFDDVDNDGPLTNEIVIKNIHHEFNYTVIEFDTVDSYWGSSHWDGVDSRDFARRIQDGSITFLYKL